MTTQGSIEAVLSEEFKAALRARDERKLSAIRMVRTEVSVAQTAAGFSGLIDDALYLRVIAAYVKKLDKARQEYLGLGERGKEMAADLAFEIAYLSRWLPQKLGVEETRQLVRSTIAALGISDPRMAGRVVGQLIKEQPNNLDGGLVKQLATEELLK